MSEPYRLPDRLVPFAGESLSGLIMRYAAIYRFTAPEQLFARLGGRRRYLPTYSALDPMSEDGAALAHCLHITPQQARLMSNWHPDRGAMGVHGHRVDVDMTDCYGRQVCPGCLRDLPYHRAAWHVSAMPCCPIHGTRLVRKCTACGERLHWRGPGLHLCQNPRCGFDLREAVAEQVPADHLTGIRGLSRLFEGAEHPTGLGFGDALRALLTLGSFRLGLPRWHRIAAFVENRREELPEILANGWAALDPWPAAYKGFLDDLVSARHDRKATRGLAKAYGNFADAVLHHADRAWAAPLVAEMADHGIGRADVDVRPHLVSRYATGRREAERHLSLSEAARMLGVSFDTAGRSAKRLGIEVGPVPQGVQRMLRAADVHRLAEARHEDAITAKDAAELLGVAVLTLAKMVRDGSVAQIPSGDRIKASLSFRRSAITALIEAFERGAAALPVVDEPGPEHRVLGRGGTRDGFGVRRISRAVISGRLKPVAVWGSGRGLGRFLFPRTFRT